MPKVILLSQLELPYSNIGSWTTMYDYYLKSNHKVDYLICPKPKTKYSNIEYSIIDNKSIISKSKRKVFNKRYSAHLSALEDIIDKGEKYIIQLIDNFGIVDHIQKLITDKFNRSNFYIQFFYHGFPPFYNNLKGRPFFENIDEMVLLTNDSYKAYKDFYTALPCRFSVLYNGVNKDVFKPLSHEEKDRLKTSFHVEHKTVFLWCSQDRPKKGLDLILDVWKRLQNKHDHIVLWVLGAERSKDIDDVKFLGKVPHDEIHKYFQAASIYLFPSLNKEGFGLTLIEALSCGNLCIAAANGGIPEVLNYGDYGVLIDRPNFIEDWIKAIDHVLTEKNKNFTEKFTEVPNEKYDIKTWCKGINNLIDNAKVSLS